MGTYQRTVLHCAQPVEFSLTFLCVASAFAGHLRWITISQYSPCHYCRPIFVVFTIMTYGSCFCSVDFWKDRIPRISIRSLMGTGTALQHHQKMKIAQKPSGLSSSYCPRFYALAHYWKADQIPVIDDRPLPRMEIDRVYLTGAHTAEQDLLIVHGAVAPIISGAGTRHRPPSDQPAAGHFLVNRQSSKLTSQWQWSIIPATSYVDNLVMTPAFVWAEDVSTALTPRLGPRWHVHVVPRLTFVLQAVVDDHRQHLQGYQDTFLTCTH